MVKTILYRFGRTLISFLIAGPIANSVGILVGSPDTKYALTGAAILAAGKALRVWLSDSKYSYLQDIIPF